MSGALGTSLVAQTLKCLPAMRDTWVQSLGQEDPLEKEMATHSSTLAWRVPWTEEPGRLQSMGLQRVGHDWATSLSLTIQSSNHSPSLVFTQRSWNLSLCKTCIRIFIAAVVILPKLGSNQGVLQWVDKLWYSHTIECYSVLKGKELLILSH